MISIGDAYTPQPKHAGASSSACYQYGKPVPPDEGEAAPMKIDAVRQGDVVRIPGTTGENGRRCRFFKIAAG
jgi:hypothetical protein